MFSELRESAFITKERVTLWSAALLLAYVVATAYLFGSAHGLTDYHGRPLGTDFADVYTAGHSVLHGDVVAPYSPAQHYRNEQALFGAKVPFYGWHYPPYFLFVAAPLARLPYIPSLAVWQIATSALYLAALWWLLRTGPKPQVLNDPRWILLALAFPAVFMNITHGQNGFLTAALLAGALAACNSRPILSGILFGLMVYKPQFGLLVPIALFAESRWKTIIAAAVTVAATTVLTFAVFGADVWSAFYHSLAFTRAAALDEGAAGYFKMQSVFAWARMWGSPLLVAYILQSLMTLGAGVLVYRTWRSDASFARKAAVLCLGSVLATPYCYDYDLMALAPAIALLISDGLGNGFRPYERLAAAMLWSVPILARPVAQWSSLPLGAIVCLGTLLLLTRRAPAQNLKAAAPA
ncbi:MAG TPA: glycosyltransferase family 87 protein [Rhizomicrobium sp.]|nr:glycosyltransferase family 87 protein [Rhizomicrobium sp.]